MMKMLPGLAQAPAAVSQRLSPAALCYSYTLQLDSDMESMLQPCHPTPHPPPTHWSRGSSFTSVFFFFFCSQIPIPQPSHGNQDFYLLKGKELTQVTFARLNVGVTDEIQSWINDVIIFEAGAIKVQISSIS